MKSLGVTGMALLLCVNAAHAATLSISANPASVASGAASTLTWNSSEATSCAASGAWSGTKATSGSQSVIAPNGLSTYALNCSAASGSASNSVVVGAGTPPPALYVLNLNLSGSGTVTSNPGGITCGATCSASYPSGAAVTLNAVPAAGYTFSGWSGACSGSGACVVAMGAHQTVTATFVGNSGTWAPPIGIPDPMFCVKDTPPALPAGWPGAQVAGFYYVDNTHPSATDTSNVYGYPDKPRLSIPTTYAAGAYAEIHGGPYDSGSTLTLTANGTSTNPVWIRGSSAATRPTMRRFVALQGTYAIVEHLFFDVTGRTLRVSGNGSAATDHICVRNLEFSGPGTLVANNAVLSVSGTVNFPTTNVIIYNNVIHGFGDWQGATENDYHGILPASYAQNVWVLNNLVYNMGGDSIQVGQATFSVAERPSYVYIGGNEFHHDRENAVDIKRASDVIVSQNKMHGYAAVSSSSGEVVAIHNDPSYVWVLFNDVSDGRIGLITTGSTDTWFIGNVIRDMHHGGVAGWDGTSLYALGAAIHFRGATTGGAIHNTLYNYDIGIQIPPGGSGFVVRNNIFAGRTEAAGMDVRIDSSNTIFDNNLLYGQGGAVRIGWSSSSAVNLAAFKTNTGKCASCPATADPLFMNPGASDFRIPANSPAVNSGIAEAAFTTFFNRYGISIAYDYLGNARTFGSSPDIGAHEAGAQ